MKNGCAADSKTKMKMNSSLEEFRIPILENLSSPRKERICCFPTSCCLNIAGVFAVVLFIWLCVGIIYMLSDHPFTTDMPQFRLDSLVLCHTTNTPNNNNLVIWDFRFHINNPNVLSTVCLHPFEVSIFIHNQTKLVTRTPVIETCVGPRNHTSTLALADALLLDPDDLSIDWMNNNRTTHFDLKIHGGFYFTHSLDKAFYRGDLVCGDAKVALLTSSSNSSCGSMVGDPVACSYIGRS